MNITECFPMRKRRSIDKTPGRSHDATVFSRSLRRTPRRLTGSSYNNSSLLDQSLDIVWDNNSPSPTRTLSLGKRKKHHGSDSSSSGGEISDLVQKLADKSGSTPEANPPLLAFWMSRENNVTVQPNKDDVAVKGDTSSKQKSKEFRTPSRRPRRVLRKCNKSKMKLLKQDIELLAHPMGEMEEETVSKETVSKPSEQQEPPVNEEDACTGVKLKGTDMSLFFDDWDNDEDDLILSQVDIPMKNNIPETQVMTNTQFLGSEEDTHQNNVTHQLSHTKAAHGTAADVDANDSIVTESWDFVDELGDSDDEDVLQNALEDFEKSQQVSIPTVRRVSHLHIKPDMSHITNIQKKELCDSLCKVNPLEKNSHVNTRSKDHCSAQQREVTADAKCTRKGNFSFIPRSSLQSSTTASSESITTQQVNQCKLKNTNSVILPQTGLQRIEKEQTNFQNTRKNNNVTRQSDSTGQSMVQRSKTAKYSKEDIERKKLEAQNRRKQKMAQSQHKH
ncbi:uncharacterized protein LOC144634576 isoform X2 [Oculina patagonica]